MIGLSRRRNRPMERREHFSCERFGSQLKRFRKEQGITQAELAEIIDVHIRQIARYESGERYPTIPHMVAIMYALKKPLWQFVDMDHETASRIFGAEGKLVPPDVELPVLLQAISDRFSTLQHQIDWMKEKREI